MSITLQIYFKTTTTKTRLLEIYFVPDTMGEPGMIPIGNQLSRSTISSQSWG